MEIALRREYIQCACSSTDHTLFITWWEKEEHDLNNPYYKPECYIDSGFDAYQRPFFSRLKDAFNYLFRTKHLVISTSTLLSKEELTKLRNVLEEVNDTIT